MTLKKPKIAFVVDTLGNHGAERYLYELLKVFSSEYNDITIVSIRQLGGFELHYLPRIEELGVKFHMFTLDHRVDEKDGFIKKIKTSFDYRVKGEAFVKEKLNQQKLTFLQQFNIVSIIKWEVFVQDRTVFNALPKINIHLMSALEQYAVYPYKDLPTTKFTIIGMYDEQKEEILKENKVQKFDFYTIPLLIELESFKYNYNPQKDSFRLAVFSRIAIDQPTIFFLFLVHLLKQRGHKVELLFYGKYYNEEIYHLYLNTVRNLNIEDVVHFKGHTFDIGGEIKNENITLGIMNAVGSMMGYSSIEILANGLPVLFYDVAHQPNNVDRFSSIEKMADKITLFIQNKDEFSTFIEDQKSKIKTRDLFQNKKHILAIYTQLLTR